MHRVSRLGIVLLVLATAVVGARQAPAPKITAFIGARLIAGDGNPMIEDSAFLVEGTRVSQIGRRGQLKIPPGAAQVNVIGKTVMPAVIDVHTHLASARTTLVSQLEHKAYYGAAVVMGLGDGGDVALQIRNELLPNAARLLTSGREISAEEPGQAVTTEDDARKAVQALAAKKVDLVEIWVDDRGGKTKKLAPNVYRAIIDEAHSRGLRVGVHAATLQDAKELLRAGVDAFLDGINESVDQEFVDAFKARGNVYYVPNLPETGFATDLSWLADTVSPEELKKLQAAAVDRPEARAAFAVQHDNMIWLHYQGGARLAFGSGGGEGWSHHLEMEDMAVGGKKGALVPLDVITAAARNSAELLGLKDYGEIKPGNIANFIVLAENPAFEMTQTRTIESVYLQGRELDREAMLARFRK
jgi:imidazolonepropionase-like amidohydrolase